MFILSSLFSLVLGVIRDIFAGFVLAKFWLWFILGRFTDMPLNVWHAVGFVLTLNVLMYLAGVINTAVAQPPKGKDAISEAITESLYKKISDLVIVYPWALLVGYIWHRFI